MAFESKHKKRGSTLTLVVMLLVLVALVAAIILWPVEAKAAPQPVTTEQDDLEQTTLIHAGDMAPDFAVEMLDGSKLTLSELKGKPVLLIFWATWCPPCRQELSHLQADVIDHFGDKITVLPISRGETRNTVEGFIAKTKYTFPIGLDEDKAIYSKYATNYVPRSFVIDGEGRVAYVAVGYDEEIAKEVKLSIENLLR